MQIDAPHPLFRFLWANRPMARFFRGAGALLSLCSAASAAEITLQNAVSEARFTYEDGIRLSSFRLAGEPNVLREGPAATRGVKTWIMAPADLVPVRDTLSEAPAQAEPLSPTAVRLWMPEPNASGLRLEWVAVLDAAEAQLTVTHRVHLEAGPPRHLSVWALAAFDTETVITAPFPRSSAFPATYPVPIHFFRWTNLGDPRLRMTREALVVDLQLRVPAANLKFGLVQPQGVLEAHRGATRARFQVDYDPLGTYPEGGGNLTVFASANPNGRGFGEVEHMSPLFLLKPQETAELVQEIRLEQAVGED